MVVAKIIADLFTALVASNGKLIMIQEIKIEYKVESLCPFVRTSVCSSAPGSDRVRSISPEPLNYFFQPNLVWWCVITRRSVMHKTGFSICNVKITVNA